MELMHMRMRKFRMAGMQRRKKQFHILRRLLTKSKSEVRVEKVGGYLWVRISSCKKAEKLLSILQTFEHMNLVVVHLRANLTTTKHFLFAIEAILKPPPAADRMDDDVDASIFERAILTLIQQSGQR